MDTTVKRRRFPVGAEVIPGTGVHSRGGTGFPTPSRAFGAWEQPTVRCHGTAVKTHRGECPVRHTSRIRSRPGRTRLAPL